MRDLSTQTSRQVSPVVDNRHLSPHVLVDIPPQMGKNLGNWNPANNWKYMMAMGLLGAGGYGAYRAMSGRKSQNVMMVPKAQAPKEYFGPDRRYHEPGNHSNLARYNFSSISTPTPSPTLNNGAEPGNHSNLARYQMPTPTPSEVIGTNPMNNVNMSHT